MDKEHYMALLMLISMLNLLYIFFSKRVFISNNKEDLISLFYGESTNNVSWYNVIFIFFIVFSVDNCIKKTFSRDDWIFFPKKNAENKPFGLFPNAYEENLKIFINKHRKWIKKYLILHIILIFNITLLFLINIF